MEKPIGKIERRGAMASPLLDLYGLSLMGVLISYFAILFFALSNLVSLVYMLGWGSLAEMPTIPRWLLISISLALVAQLAWRLAIDIPGLVTAVYDPMPQGKAGIYLEPNEHPELYELVQEVGEKIAAPLPDRILVGHTAACFVTEERRFSIQTQRKLHLVMGMPQFSVLTIDELKVILAHELAHFGLGETRLRVFGFRFVESMNAALNGMGRGWWRLINPVYWYCLFYATIFVRLAGPIERRLELRADAISAAAFGGDLAVHTFLKNWQLEAQFNDALEQLADSSSGELKFTNIYRWFTEAWQELSNAGYQHLLRRLAEEESPSLADSHPTTQERIRVMSGYPSQPKLSPRSAHQLIHHIADVEDRLDSELRRSFASLSLAEKPS